jgi:hypothetical protein
MSVDMLMTYIRYLITIILGLCVIAWLYCDRTIILLSQQIVCMSREFLIGEAAVVPRPSWMVSALRDEPGGPTRMFGIIPSWILGADAEKEPRADRYVIFHVIDGCDVSGHIMFSEMADEERKKVRQLLASPAGASEFLTDAEAGTFQGWNALVGAATNNFVSIPELRLVITASQASFLDEVQMRKCEVDECWKE